MLMHEKKFDVKVHDLHNQQDIPHKNKNRHIQNLKSIKT